jgi:imidazole glycerol-phosphate synthase subunit HisH
MQTIAVIDYGMGNVRSVMRALEFVSEGKDEIILTAIPDEIRRADRIVFPGQGAAADCMQAIDQSELREVIIETTHTRPFLGICMGMQVLMSESDENNGVSCLDVYPGKVRYFGKPLVNNEGHNLKVPQMGWNRVIQTKEHPLWTGIDNKSWFYFVHSYYVETSDEHLVSGICDYGLSFAAAIARDNVFAMQCHPEKSADSGLKLLSNFIQWDGQS